MRVFADCLYVLFRELTLAPFSFRLFVVLIVSQSHHHPKCTQSPHQSETAREMSLCRQAVGGELYACDVSYLPPDGLLSKSYPIATINSGTEEYIKLGLDELFERASLSVLPVGLADTACSLNGRGNRQVTYGVNGAQNVLPFQDKDMCVKYCGVACPQVNVGTLENNVISPRVAAIQEALKDAGKIAKVDYCQDDFLANNPRFVPYFEYLRDVHGGVAVVFAAVTVAVLFLEGSPPDRISRHTDDLNDPDLSAVVMMSQVDRIQGRLARVTWIGYQRKSVSDMLLRLGAAREMRDKMDGKLRSWLNEEAHLYPGVPIEMYHQSCGSKGVVVLMEKDKPRPLVAALVSNSSSDKQGNYLSSYLFAIHQLKRHKGLLDHETVELCTLSAHLCTLFGPVCQLLLMSEGFDRSASRKLHGGIFELVIRGVNSLFGCLSGGPGRRCLNFLNKPMKLTDCYKNFEYVAGCNSSCRDATTNADKRKESRTILENVAKNVKHCGEFSAQHLSHISAKMNLLPPYVYDYAMVSSTVTQNKKKSNRPEMSRLVASDVEGQPLGNTMAKQRHQNNQALSAVTRCVNARLGLRMSEGQVENCICEAYRTTRPDEHLFPNGGFLRREETEDGSNEFEWNYYTPFYDDERGEMRYVKGGPDKPYLGIEVRVPPDSEPLDESMVWDPKGKEEMMISVGKKSSDLGQFYVFTITQDMYETDNPEYIANVRRAFACRDSKANTHHEAMDRFWEVPGTQDYLRLAMASKSGKRPKNMGPAGKRSKTSQGTADGKGKKTKLERNLPKEGAGGSTLSNLHTLYVPNWKEIGNFSIAIRIFEDKRQFSTAVDNKWPGVDSLQSLANVPVAKSHVIHNEAHAAMSQGRAPSLGLIPKIKSARRGKGRVTPNLTVASYPFEERFLYRAVFVLLPIIGECGGCMVQDSMALAIGGIRHDTQGDGKHYWCFHSPSDAKNFVLVCIIALCGNNQFLRRIGKLLDSCASQDEARKVVAFCQQGKVVYYWIGLPGISAEEGGTPIAIAVPDTRSKFPGKPLVVRLR